VPLLPDASSTPEEVIGRTPGSRVDSFGATVIAMEMQSALHADTHRTIRNNACVAQQLELSTVPTRVVGQQSPTKLHCLQRGPCAATLQRTPAVTGSPLACRVCCYPEAQAAAAARQAAAGDLRTVCASIQLVLHGCDRLLHALLCSGASSS